MKAKKWLGCGLALLMTVSMCSLFAACNKTDDTPEDPNTVTVRFYDGRTEIKAIKVTKGSTVEDWLPTKDGYDFRGWFEEASFAKPWDSTKVITKNTAVFSRWRTQNPEPETRMWYLRGSVMGSDWLQLTNNLNKDKKWVVSNPTLKDGSPSDPLFFKPLEGAPSNTFYLDVDVMPGSWGPKESSPWSPSPKFRFVCNLNNEDWTSDDGTDSQLGLGNLVGFDFATGYNPEKGSGFTEKEKCLYGEVASDDGTIVFYGGKEYNNPSYTWNIYVKEEMSGVYRFIFRSFPGSEQSMEVSWSRIKYLPHVYVDNGNGSKREPNGKCDECGLPEAEHTNITSKTPAGPKSNPAS